MKELKTGRAIVKWPKEGYLTVWDGYKDVQTLTVDNGTRCWKCEKQLGNKMHTYDIGGERIIVCNKKKCRSLLTSVPVISYI